MKNNFTSISRSRKSKGSEPKYYNYDNHINDDNVIEARVLSGEPAQKDEAHLRHLLSDLGHLLCQV